MKMKILPIELKTNSSKEEYIKGFRILYYYDDNYSIGEYSKNIEGFMTGFADCDSIIDDNDIPEFISVDDLLNRYLDDMKNITGVAIYNINCDCIGEKGRGKSLEK